MFVRVTVSVNGRFGPVGSCRPIGRRRQFPDFSAICHSRAAVLSRRFVALGEQDSGAGVARAWRGRGAGYMPFMAWGGAGVARAWRGRGAGMSYSPWGHRTVARAWRGHGAGVARACPVPHGQRGGGANHRIHLNAYSYLVTICPKWSVKTQKCWI
eukprot:gene85-biopygen3042